MDETDLGQFHPPEGKPMDPKVGDDLLWGVEEIAKEIRQPVRQVYWRLENGQLPAGKQGQTWVASRQALRKFFAELTANTPAPAKCITNQEESARQTRRKAGMKKAVTAA
jgi:hypothetical protein